MAKNEVTVKEETTAVAAPNTYMVEVSKEDMMIPFLKVIQSLSEEVMQGKDKFNPDVRPGDIYDGVTKTIFKNAKVIVCGLRKYYTEWTPEVRGVLVGKHAANSGVVLNAVKTERATAKGFTFVDLTTETGNQLVETYGVVMLIKAEDGTVLPGVLTLSKTSFAVGKQLNTLLAIKQSAGVPIFTLSTTSTSNAKGSWYKPSFAFDSYEKDAGIIQTAAEMSKLTDNILFRNEDELDSTAATADISEGIL